METKNNLQPLLSECEENEVRKELQDNILFCDEAVKNLRSELRSLEGNKPLKCSSLNYFIIEGTLTQYNGPVNKIKLS